MNFTPAIFPHCNCRWGMSQKRAWYSLPGLLTVPIGICFLASCSRLLWKNFKTELNALLGSVFAWATNVRALSSFGPVFLRNQEISSAYGYANPQLQVPLKHKEKTSKDLLRMRILIGPSQALVLHMVLITSSSGNWEKSRREDQALLYMSKEHQSKRRSVKTLCTGCNFF